MRCKGADILINCENRKEEGAEAVHYSAVFEEIEFEDCRIGRVDINIPRSDTWDMMGFDIDSPVQLDLFVDEKPLKLTCMYMYGEWWTRPFFAGSFMEIPKSTQVLYCKFPDHYSCVLPIVGKKYKTTIMGSDDPGKLHMVLDSGTGGERTMNEDIYVIADGRNLKEAMDKVFNALSMRYGIKLRDKRNVPEIFKYIGWCSWDAFYKDISEEKIREKAKEFSDKNIPVRWMIFDDGWMKSKDDMLEDFVPDKEKFPDGFSSLIEDIKESTSIRWFGVWHAFGGYWAGVDPSSTLAEKEKKYLYMTRNGRLVPSPVNGSGFYKDWYKYLKNEQIDFVKVDGQSAIRTYFRNDLSIPEAARGLSKELEKGSEIMEKSVINCMGMAMENIVSRPETAISRNSDDFVPGRDGGFAEHLLQNAFNALYHNQIYCCDWDMFWTRHPDAEKHGLLRAISGGPIYFSDQIGATDPEIVSKLCLMDGSILMFDRSACISDDSAFTDPHIDGAIKMHNVGTLCDGRKVGIIAAFNLSGDEQHINIDALDIPELYGNIGYELYDYRNKMVHSLRPGETKDMRLNAGDYAYYIFIPHADGENIQCLGLTDKFAGVLASGEIRTYKGVLTISLKETGRVTFISSKTPASLQVNGVDRLERLNRVNNNVYELAEEASNEKMVIEVSI